MDDGQRELVERVRAALAAAHVPLADDPFPGDPSPGDPPGGVPAGGRLSGGRPGAVVRATAHGVCVSWQAGEDAPHGRTGAGRATGRVAGSTSVMSPEFQATLHLAAVLAHAGHHSDHLGDRVLVTSHRPWDATCG